MKPVFLIIGAQKCATSWLHYHLRQHPALFLPEQKDHEFFSYVGNLNRRSFSQWCRRFTVAPQGRKIGDANAAYFWTSTDSAWSNKPGSFNPSMPQSIRKFLGGKLKLIIILRDPVERAVSAYLHHIAHGAISPSETIESIDAPLGIIDMGFYGEHLENWLECFPAKQFLLINGLPYGQHAGRLCLNEITSFLDVETFPEAHPSEMPVFPGLPRLFQDDGVWVAAEHPLIAQHMPLTRNVPLESSETGNYVRLIDRRELDRLELMFREDQQKLADLLANNDIRELTPATILELNRAG